MAQLECNKTFHEINLKPGTNFIFYAAPLLIATAIHYDFIQRANWKLSVGALARFDWQFCDKIRKVKWEEIFWGGVLI